MSVQFLDEYARSAQEQDELGAMPRKSRLRQAAEIVAEPIPAAWLLRPYLEQMVLALLYGELGTLKSFVTLDMLLSIAAGVTITAIEQAAAAEVAVVRAMPNTPALVGKGVAAIAGGRYAGDDDVAWADRILSGVGTVVRVDEAQLDAVTGGER